MYKLIKTFSQNSTVYRPLRRLHLDINLYTYRIRHDYRRFKNQPTRNVFQR